MPETSPPPPAPLSLDCTAWTARDIASLDQAPHAALPLLALEPALRHDGFDLWDMWPVECADGSLPRFGESTLWMVLAAPVMPDPEERHFLARIHLLSERAGQWTLHGPAFPDGFTPGHREWSGSALLAPETGRVTVFFTAAGRRGEAKPTFEQRLFQSSGTLRADTGGGFAITDWTPPLESIVADGTVYLKVDQSEGVAGTIKAFRDPGFFRDPRNGEAYLVFTGSAAESTSAWNGVIGIAKAGDDTLTQWELLPPLISADGLNNELERPHIRHWDGAYYLFWSTQRKVFATPGPVSPTGLYGMVAPTPLGPYVPLNGTGLVAANPEQAPSQAYSWWVLADGRVNAFVDLPGIAAPQDVAAGPERRAAFGGYPTPFSRIIVSGATTRLV